MNDLRLKVGKSYDSEDGEIVTIVYESKHRKAADQYRFIGVIDTYNKFKMDYYWEDGIGSKRFLSGGELVKEHSIWREAEQDTLVRVRLNSVRCSNNLRYFDRYEHGKVYCFRDGRTSSTSCGSSEAFSPELVEIV